ncbi:MAG: exodeoxyribonuclease VII large subunit [Clostridia bacterium]|nr:exodeoxyribonuclease VII large subunit [Clostridia bacterium]
MPVVTVSQLNNYMKRYIDQNSHLSDLWIKGEISNYKHHYSGHIYLTLKDDSSTLKAVMFKANALTLKFKPSDGMKIVAFGKISVYEPGGTYQLYIDTMIPDGKGELYAAYEQLKAKLSDEGLFDEDHKKKLIPYPKRIGVVTSVSGAAVQDILNVISRRCKSVDVVIYPVKVQGIGASESICDGISYFSDNKNVDMIIIARGGGSIEDLWAFNEENTARAIYECQIPVISGVGHETDFTIADFVADFRAPTPSAAAEVATPSTEETIRLLKNYQNHLTFQIDSIYSKSRSLVKNIDSRKMYYILMQNISEYFRIYENLNMRILGSFDKKILEHSNLIEKYSATIEALNPRKILKRGYTITTSPDGSISDFSQIVSGDEINVIFDSGKLECIVRRVIHDKKE